MGLSYDPASQVNQILHQLTATSTPINQAAYAYNPVGNRTSLTDRRGSQTFGCDCLDRLTKVEDFVAGNPTAFATSTYRYDGLGRRIEKVANGQTKRLSRSSCRCNFGVRPRALETQ